MDFIRGTRQYDPMTMVMATTAIIGAGASVYGGVQQNKQAKAEAALQQRQADIAYEESKVNATNEAFNQTQAVQRQKLAFLSSGVTLEGSPLMVLEQSRQYGQSQVDAILRQGQAQKDLGYEQAKITKNAGRAALIGGTLKGVSQLGSAAVDLNKAGAFDTKTAKTTGTK